MGFLNRFKKILIIEDDAVLRSALAEQFKSKGYGVIEAGDAREGLSQVGTMNPSAIVLDLILPIKDGITFLTELRQDGYTMPVVILSNLLGTGDLREDAERLQASFYNKSSTSLEAVVEAVERKL